MSEDSPPAPPVEEKQELSAYVIEGARSSRSRCKICRRPIEKGTLRIGYLIEGPFGTGYLWHLGEYKLICGDARLQESYVQTMANQQASMIMTDPPDHLAW